MTLKYIKQILLLIIIPIAVVILTIGLYALQGLIQQRLFLPPDYILWMMNKPGAYVIFVFEVFLLFYLMACFHKDFRAAMQGLFQNENKFWGKNKKLIVSAFIFLNVILIYVAIFSATVFTAHEIIVYSPLKPRGETYNWGAIVEIDTGLKASGSNRGDFFYIIELENGNRFDLANLAGTQEQVDSRVVLKELDQKLVKQGVLKKASLENFEYTKEHLAPAYYELIRDIIEYKE